MTEQISLRQRRLATLTRATTGTIRVTDAAKALNLDRVHAAKLLAGWHKQGVIRRVARGLYVPVKPSSLGQTQVLDDPWTLVPELYEPGYIGGWSALEHWEFTEQLFRSICVLTSKRTTKGERKHQGVSFYVKPISEKRQFGTKTVWRDNVKLQVSDPGKTMLDIIDDPYIGAGLQHTVDCLREFNSAYDTQQDYERLLVYAAKFQNGALFKKLGFLAEMLEFKKSFLDECAKRLTTGYAVLDRNAQDRILVTRWRLWVPKGIEL